MPSSWVHCSLQPYYMDPVKTQYQIKSAMYISHAQCLRAIMQKITRNVCTVYTVNIGKYGITDVHCHQCHCIVQESRAAARKPRDAASVLFRWSSPTTFTTSIRKTSQASKAATLQSSKHAGAKHNLTQNQDSKSIKVTCLESVEKQWGNK